MKKILVVLIGNIIYDARVSKEIDTLLKFGYKVVLLQSEPLGQIASLPYKVYITPKEKSRKFSFAKIANIISFSNRLKEIISVESPDYIHCNDINALVYALRFVKSQNVVYDSHELATECERGLKRLLIYRIEKYLIPYLHAIIIPQIDRLNYFGFKYPNSKDKLYLLENFPTRFNVTDEDVFKSEFGINRGDNKIVFYSGAINDERKVKELVYAVKPLENIVLVLVGFASEKYMGELNDIIKANGLSSKVYYFKPVAHGVIKRLAGSADIGVCFYDDPNLNSYFCASNKLYELMDSGTYVLSNNTVGASRVIGRENGVCINTTSVEDIRRGLLLLSKCTHAPKMNYWWETQEDVLKEIYN